MIPAIFLEEHQREAVGKESASVEKAVRDANTEAGAVLGFASAIGAYGGFFIPMSYGASISMTGTAEAALYAFIVFYLTCIAITWWFYTRRSALMLV
jgi:NNP family nitrate/nitrite transporter-like MFS transporter